MKLPRIFGPRLGSWVLYGELSIIEAILLEITHGIHKVFALYAALDCNGEDSAGFLEDPVEELLLLTLFHWIIFFYIQLIVNRLRRDESLDAAMREIVLFFGVKCALCEQIHNFIRK